MSAHPHGNNENPDTSHERSDINVRAIIWAAVALATIVITIDVAMWGMFGILDRIEVKNDPYVSPLAPAAGTKPPEPRLQVTPWEDLKHFRADETNYLHSYGWVDEKTGVAHIPIEKAKQLLLQRGLPSRPQPDGQTDASEGTHVASTGESSGGRNLPGGMADTSTVPAPAAAPAATPVAAPGAPGSPAPSAAPAVKKPGGGQ